MNACSGHSKDESGFLAVPLVQRGVVVVAVGYSIAPKGTAHTWALSREHAGSNVSVLYSGNMDLMVSQVRRSVVSVLQQYSHIRSVRCDEAGLRWGGWWDTCPSWRLSLCRSAVGYTCVVIQQELTWPLWFCPRTGLNMTYHHKSKVNNHLRCVHTRREWSVTREWFTC